MAWLFWLSLLCAVSRRWMWLTRWGAGIALRRRWCWASRVATAFRRCSRSPTLSAPPLPWAPAQVQRQPSAQASFLHIH